VAEPPDDEIRGGYVEPTSDVPKTLEPKTLEELALPCNEASKKLERPDVPEGLRVNSEAPAGMCDPSLDAWENTPALPAKRRQHHLFHRGQRSHLRIRGIVIGLQRASSAAMPK
jgi:hypothetical protein